MDGYQSFCLLADSDNRLYAFGFRLDGLFRDWVDVYEVLLDADDLVPNSMSRDPRCRRSRMATVATSQVF